MLGSLHAKVGKPYQRHYGPLSCIPKNQETDFVHHTKQNFTIFILRNYTLFKMLI